MRALLLALLVACGPSLDELHTRGDVPDERDAQCVQAEARLASLKCKQAPKFAEACVRAAQDGRDWRADCIAQVTSCADVTRVARIKTGMPCQ